MNQRSCFPMKRKETDVIIQIGLKHFFFFKRGKQALHVMIIRLLPNGADTAVITDILLMNPVEQTASVIIQ